MHIIQKQSYQLAVQTEQQGLRMQKQLQDINLRYIAPALNDKLNEFFGGEEIITIEKLELNIGVLGGNASPGEWSEKITAALEKAINELNLTEPGKKESRLVSRNKRTHAVSVFHSYLETGLLMQGSVYNSFDELKKDLLQPDDNQKEMFKALLLQSANKAIIAERLSAFSPPDRLLFLQLFIPGLNKEDWLNLFNDIVQFAEALWENEKKTASIPKQAFIRKIFNASFIQLFRLAEDGKPLKIQEIFLFAKAFAGQVMQHSPSSAEDTTLKSIYAAAKQQESILSKQEAADALTDDFFIADSGLCLLAPYLPVFFSSLDLCDRASFYNEYRQQHAVYLLHYLATGQFNPSEEKLLLSKLLCGWPLHMPCFNDTAISEEEKLASEDLLRSVIEHWSVLKSTSPDGLREGFLMREGKLSIHEDHYLLQVEQRSIDILLEQVSWSFRMIKLPWMKKVLQVEWY